MQLVQIEDCTATHPQTELSSNNSLVSTNQQQPQQTVRKFTLFTGSHDKTLQQWDVEVHYLILFSLFFETSPKNFVIFFFSRHGKISKL
jgi:hypothetical protein